MPLFELPPVETRVLGCLLEKERTTPENYPLSLNSLMLACNQSTNRDPITNYDEKAVEAALWGLREKKLAVMVFAGGARVQKFRHTLLDHFNLERPELGILCVLLLRGPQTPGELRTRTERFYAFPHLQELETCLQGLSEGESPFVRLLPPRPGQKERRYVQLLSGEPDEALLAAQAAAPSPAPAARAMAHAENEARIAAVEQTCAELKTELAALKEAFEAFRKQFE